LHQQARQHEAPNPEELIELDSPAEVTPRLVRGSLDERQALLHHPLLLLRRQRWEALIRALNHDALPPPIFAGVASSGSTLLPLPVSRVSLVCSIWRGLARESRREATGCEVSVSESVSRKKVTISGGSRF